MSVVLTSGMDSRALGLGVAAMLCVSGCYRDSDDFNAKAADYICRYNDQDPDRPFLDHTPGLGDSLGVDPEPYSGPYCEDAVASDLTSCADACEYSARKARRCLRKLRRGVRRESYNESALSVCERVYTCPDAASVETYRSCRITTRGCAVGGRSGGTPLALLLFAGLFFRRRRR